MTRLVPLVLASHAGLVRLFRLLSALVDGFWLGVLDEDALDALDAAYYTRHRLYVDESYNFSGLKEWERCAFETHFPPTGRLVVTGAGAGREVLALLNLGYDVVGYEPHAQLAAQGQKFLEAAGHSPSRLRCSARSSWSHDGGPIDGVVVGWGSYSLIRGRSRRVAFLRSVRECLHGDAPVLLSFFVRDGSAWPLRLTSCIGSTLRRLRQRPPLQVGDLLDPNYVHYFDHGELCSELEAARLQLIAYHRSPYGHALARRS